MFVEVAVATTLVLALAWSYAEMKRGRVLRLSLGALLTLSTAAVAWGIRDLQFRHYAYRVTQAMEEISSIVRAGRGDSIHAPIAEFAGKVRHDPSLGAAVDLVRDLKSTNSD